MSTISEEHISNIVGKIALNCNLTEWEHSVSKLDSIGQNYFGIITPVTLTGKSENGLVELHIVLKLAPTDEKYRGSGAVTRFFIREIYVYSNLHAKYRQLQQDLPQSSQLVIPRLFYTHDDYCNEVIAMQDMTKDGYKPCVNVMFLDLDHVTVALKALARLHALSFILKSKDPKVYDEITDVCVPLSEKTNKRYMEIMTDRLAKALTQFQGTQHVQLLEKLKRNCGKYYDKTNEMANGKCICHGDAWKENILFKYEGDKPVSCCLIDYQTARISSPAFDTLYLIVSSTDTNLRRKYYHQLLDNYYQTFDQMLKDCGVESQSVYSTQTFARDLKIVAPTCLITANTAIWLTHGLQEEGHVRSKRIFMNPEEKAEAMQGYKTVVGSIIEDFYKYGYLPSEILK